MEHRDAPGESVRVLGYELVHTRGVPAVVEDHELPGLIALSRDVAEGAAEK